MDCGKIEASRREKQLTSASKRTGKNSLSFFESIPSMLHGHHRGGRVRRLWCVEVDFGFRAGG